MSDKPEILDLDDLVPKKCIVKFEELEIEILPPKTAEFLYLGQLAGKMSEVDKMEPAAIDQLVADIEAQIGKLIPQLAGKHFNSAQLTKLMDIITDMGMPADAKELERRKIQADSEESPKKV